MTEPSKEAVLIAMCAKGPDDDKRQMASIDVPNPGSDEAIAIGCRCAVLDNNHGAGFPYGGNRSFWISGNCPLHAIAPPTREPNNAKS